MTGSGDCELEIVSRFRSRLIEDLLGEGARPLADCLEDVPRQYWALAARVWMEMTGEGSLPIPATVAEGSEEAGDFGPYRLIRELGRGGQGSVHLAEDLRLGRQVALKVLEGWASSSELAIRRLRREAEVASKVDDPGICTVYETGVESGTPFIAMRYVEGQSLAQRIAVARKAGAPAAFEIATAAVGGAGGGSDEESSSESSGSASRRGRAAVLEVVALIEKVARSLHAAHETGVLHRDIKPGNIMVTPSGDPVITDFGIARQEEGDQPTLTRTGEVFGTPAYMSPEQLGGRAQDLDRRSDVWSLGVTLYECLTLQRPFEAPTRDALFRAIEGHEPSDPRQLNRAIPQDLRVVLDVALEKERDRRYQTALDLAEELRRVRQSEPIHARRAGPVLRLRRWARRQPAVAALLAILLVLLPASAAVLTLYVAALPRVEQQRAAEVAEERDRLLEMGFLELGDGEARAALAAFVSALGKDRISPEAYAGMVLAHWRLGELEVALEVLEELPPAVARRGVFRSLQARTLRHLGRDAVAGDLENRSSPPADGVDFYLLAAAELGRGHAGEETAFSRAMELNDRALLHAPGQRALYAFQRADLLGHLGPAEAARDMAELLVRQWPDRAVAHYWAAHALSKADDPEAAIAEYREAFRLDPGLGSARIGIGLRCAELGRFAEAIGEYDALLRDDPDDTVVLNDKALALNALGRSDEALSTLRRAAEIDPDNASTLNNLGAFLRDRELFRESIAAARRAVALQPRSVLYLESLARSLVAVGALEEAEARLREALDVDPNYARAMVELCSVLISLERPEEALAVGKQALAIDPNQAKGWGLAGDILRRAGRPTEAIASYREALKIEPNFHEARCGLGQALGMAGECDEAIAVLEELAAVRPELAHFAMGEIHSGHGRHEEAAEAFRLAAVADPDLAMASHNLGISLEALHRPEEARRAYEEAIQRDPDLAVAHLNRGILLKKAGFEAEGSAALLRAVACDPRHPSIRYCLGYDHYRQGRYVEAVAEFEHAVELDPKSALYRRGLGDALKRAGRLSDAVAAYRVAIELEPEFPSVYRAFATALRRLGRDEECTEILQRGIGVVPDGAGLRYDLGHVLKHRGLRAQSIAAYRDAIRLDPDYAEAHCDLGLVLQESGRYAEALRHLRTGHRLGSGRSSWRYPSATWISACEELVAQELRLLDVLEGRQSPRDVEDFMLLARVALGIGRYRAAARLYREGFQAEPRLEQDFTHLTAAARAAAATGTHPLRMRDDPTASEEWRHSALGWLRGALDALAHRFERARITESRLAAVLEAWQGDPLLSGVRDLPALATLPDAEEAEWRALWADVEALLSEVSEL